VRVLVTGGAGAIGSHVCEALLARGDDVAVLDSFHDFYPRARKERNLDAFRDHASFRGVFEGDIRDRGFVRKTCEELRPEAVIHLAARAGVRPSVEEPLDYVDVNVNGTAVVVAEAVQAGVARLLFASSSTVYGLQSGEAFVEDAGTDFPLSPYGASKRAGELLCHAMHRQSDLAITCLRFFSVYGPRQRPDLALAAFARRMLAGEPIVLLGDGSFERDFTYYTDIVSGVLSALDRADGFRIYNLGRGKPVSMNRAIELLEREIGVRAERDLRPAHPADMPRNWASIDRAARDLGYAPRVDLEEGIGHYVRWLREQPCEGAAWSA